jgi:hypothetical protein
MNKFDAVWIILSIALGSLFVYVLYRCCVKRMLRVRRVWSDIHSSSVIVSHAFPPQAKPSRSILERPIVPTINFDFDFNQAWAEIDRSNADESVMENVSSLSPSFHTVTAHECCCDDHSLSEADSFVTVDGNDSTR